MSFMSEPMALDTSAMQLTESESEVTSGAAVFLRSSSLETTAASATSWGGVFLRSPGLEMAAASVRDGGASVRDVGRWSRSGNASVGYTRYQADQDDHAHQNHVSETESDDGDIGFDELKKKFAQTSHGFELKENYSEEEVKLEEDAEEGELVWGCIVVGDKEEVRVLSDEEKELASSQAGNKRKRDLHEANEVAFMLRAGSPQVQELQPLVSQLKTEIANLKSAILDEATTGEIQRRCCKEHT